MSTRTTDMAGVIRRDWQRLGQAGPIRVLAREMPGRVITVNAAPPDPTATPLFFEGKDQATVDRVAKLPQLERLATHESISAFVAFFADPGRWINGQVVYVSGGVT